MSLLRYNIVSGQRAYRPSDKHLKNFFDSIREGRRPIDQSQDESTVLTDTAQVSSGAVKKKVSTIGKTKIMLN